MASLATFLNTELFNARFAAVAACLCAFSLSACTQSTLSSVNTQPEPQPIVQNASYNPDPGSFDQAQRDVAVQEIRTKAAQSGSGELTNAFASGDGPNETMTPERQAELIHELEQKAAQNQQVVPEGELSARQNAVRDMQYKARSHYDNAITQIQN